MNVSKSADQSGTPQSGAPQTVQNKNTSAFRLPGLRQSAGFLVAGATGFVVISTVSVLLTRAFSMSPFLAWPPALVVAIFCTWLINRRWTFASSNPRKLTEFSRYGAVSLVSAGVNYLVYCLSLLGMIGAGMTGSGTTQIFAASAAGSAIAAVVTFILSRELVFRSSPPG